MDLQTYASVSRIIAPILAITFWVITIWFVWVGAKHHSWWRHMGMLCWTCNAAIFWSISAFWRLTIGGLPAGWAVPFNFYSTVLYIQAAFTMLFFLVLRSSAPSPRAPDDPYSSPEVGPDDD